MQGIQINKQTVRSQLELEKKIELLKHAKIVCTTLASKYAVCELGKLTI